VTTVPEACARRRRGSSVSSRVAMDRLENYVSERREMSRLSRIPGQVAADRQRLDGGGMQDAQGPPEGLGHPLGRRQRRGDRDAGDSDPERPMGRVLDKSAPDNGLSKSGSFPYSSDFFCIFLLTNDRRTSHIAIRTRRLVCQRVSAAREATVLKAMSCFT
jgi:hypothetical protein